MLYISIPETEKFNEETGEIFKINSVTLQLEHSLKSIRNWESKWKIPFFNKEEMTVMQTIDYIKCMTINKVDPLVYSCLTNKDINDVMSYITDPMTATTFSKLEQQRPSREIITAEIIYYWMVQAQIPFECEKWHLNQLLTLIEVCSRKNAPPKKMSKKDLATRNRNLNAARKAKLGSRG